MNAGKAAQIRNVTKSYQTRAGTVVALDAVELDIRANDYIAIMGPSGSGKSTLLNVLGGIDRPTAGEVHVDGERIDTLSERKLLDIRRRKVGFVFQEARLMLSLTAIENVMLPTAFTRQDRADARDRAQMLLDKVGVGRRADHMVHELSGGEAQRVCIARALAARPAIVLADEPTGNLDHKTRLGIVGLLEDMRNEGSALVIVTHDPEVASRARRRFAMRDGKLVEESPRH
ncbi:MAG: ABC transporter ATP-binding protein [Alphaproteobacteria bacterium]|nr:ABC transporter ATP-binding protein [Alphaproteobacteria bacterium]